MSNGKKKVEVEKKEGEVGVKKIRDPNRLLTEKEQEYVRGMQHNNPKAFGGADLSKMTKSQFIRGGGRRRMVKEKFIQRTAQGIIGLLGINAARVGSGSKNR